MSLEVFLIKEGKNEFVNNLTGADFEFNAGGESILCINGNVSREGFSEGSGVQIVSLQRDFFDKKPIDLLLSDAVAGLSWKLHGCKLTKAYIEERYRLVLGCTEVESCEFNSI